MLKREETPLHQHQLQLLIIKKKKKKTKITFKWLFNYFLHLNSHLLILKQESYWVRLICRNFSKILLNIINRI